MTVRCSLRCLTRAAWIERLEAEQLLQRDAEPARDAVEQQDHGIGLARRQPSIGEWGHVNLTGNALDRLASQPSTGDVLLDWHSSPCAGLVQPPTLPGPRRFGPVAGS